MISDKVRESLRALIKEQRWSDVQLMLTEEARKVPESEEILYYQGVLFIGLGKKEEAIATLGYAIRQAVELNRFLLAMAASAKLEEISPADVQLRIRRADLYLSMGLDRAAYEYLIREFEFYRRRNNPHALYLIVRKMLSIDEENLDLALNMAKMLSHLGQKEEARRTVENVIFTLQGRGSYEEATRIQTEYEYLYEDS